MRAPGGFATSDLRGLNAGVGGSNPSPPTRTLHQRGESRALGQINPRRAESTADLVADPR